MSPEVVSKNFIIITDIIKKHCMVSMMGRSEFHRRGR